MKDLFKLPAAVLSVIVFIWALCTLDDIFTAMDVPPAPHISSIYSELVEIETNLIIVKTESEEIDRMVDRDVKILQDYSQLKSHEKEKHQQ